MSYTERMYGCPNREESQLTFRIRWVWHSAPNMWVMHRHTYEANSEAEALVQWEQGDLEGTVDHVLSRAEKVDLLPTLPASGLVDIVEWGGAQAMNER